MIRTAAYTSIILVLILYGRPRGSQANADEEKPFLLEKYRGHVLYLDFWASWCVPCRQSFPWMMTLQETYLQEGLVVIAVNLDRDRQAAEEFIASFEPNFEILYDPTGKLAKRFEVQAMPYSLLIDRQGKRRLRHAGFKKKDTTTLERQIQALLQEPVKEDKK